MIICARCEKEKEASNNDPDFCEQCVFDLSGGMMQKAIAARCFINQVPHSNKQAKILEVAAGLDIFFPALSNNKREKILQGLIQEN